MQWWHQITCLCVLNLCAVMCVLTRDRNQAPHDPHGHDVTDNFHSQPGPSTGRKAKIDYDLWRENSTSADNHHWGDPDPNPWKPMVKYGAKAGSQIETQMTKTSSAKPGVRSKAVGMANKGTGRYPHDNYIGEATDVTLGTSLRVVDNVSEADAKESIIPSQEVPLHILRSLNSIHSSDDLYKYLFKTGPPASVGVEVRFGHDDLDVTMEGRKSVLPSANVPVAVPAPCIPALEVVTLPVKMDPSVIVWPTCSRIERCGGCCSSDLLQCEADSLEMIQMNVIKSSYIGNGQFQYSGMETVSVEKHLSCRCGCKVKESHCTAGQVYDETECRCLCNNDREREMCSREHSTKFWDPGSCQCKCRRETMCSTGMYFSHDICKCTQIPLSGRSYSENELVNRGFSLYPTTTHPTTTTTTEKTWESWLQSIKIWKKRQH